MAGVEITMVKSDADVKAFIQLPWTIYRAYPNWVPPIRREVRQLLDPESHPFWHFSERVLFLARRGKCIVGRIAGIVDRNYNRYHNEAMGIWGFFECADDPQAARALFSSVEGWVSDKGMTFLRGPLNPSTNYEVGLLAEGHELPPTFMMPFNPPYYLRLAEDCGLRKEKDLLAFLVTKDYRLPPWVDQLVARAKERSEIWIRPVRPKDFHSEVALIKELYHASWRDNWGFVPMTDEELNRMAAGIVKIMDTDLVFFVYFRDKPAGVGLILPDINPLLRRLNGQLGLQSLWKLLVYRREIVGLRGMLFGIRQEYRQTGLPLIVLDYLARIIRQKGYRYLELGWNLEDNAAINQAYEDGGLKPCKRYRILRKEL